MAHQIAIPANPASEYDQALRRFFLNVLLVMGIGLGITAAVSLWISHSTGLMTSLFHLTQVMKDGEMTTVPAMSGWWLTAAALQLGMVLLLSGTRVSRFGKGMSYLIFFAYAGLTGVTMAPALYAYTDTSIAMVFFITASMFIGCALFGYTTKYDLKPLGAFFLMGLIGLLVALFVNFVFQSAAFDYAVSVIGVLLFAGLTAYDMQKLQALYDRMGSSDDLVVYGALSLYLDFINMFLFLLRLFGARKS